MVQFHPGPLLLSGGNRRLVSVSHSDTVVCVGSTPTLRTIIWDHRSVVRTKACHALGAGSIPAGPVKSDSVGVRGR